MQNSENLRPFWFTLESSKEEEDVLGDGHSSNQDLEQNCKIDDFGMSSVKRIKLNALRVSCCKEATVRICSQLFFLCLMRFIVWVLLWEFHEQSKMKKHQSHVR